VQLHAPPSHHFLPHSFVSFRALRVMDAVSFCALLLIAPTSHGTLIAVHMVPKTYSRSSPRKQPRLQKEGKGDDCHINQKPRGRKDPQPKKVSNLGQPLIVPVYRVSMLAAKPWPRKTKKNFFFCFSLKKHYPLITRRVTGSSTPLPKFSPRPSYERFSTVLRRLTRFYPGRTGRSDESPQA
jgi:hypothetical protein